MVAKLKENDMLFNENVPEQKSVPATQPPKNDLKTFPVEGYNVLGLEY